MGEFQSAVRKRESDSAKCAVGGEAKYYQLATDRLEPHTGDDQLSTNSFEFNYGEGHRRSCESHRGYHQKSAGKTWSLTVCRSYSKIDIYRYDFV